MSSTQNSPEQIMQPEITADMLARELQNVRNERQASENAHLAFQNAQQAHNAEMSQALHNIIVQLNQVQNNAITTNRPAASNQNPADNIDAEEVYPTGALKREWLPDRPNKFDGKHDHFAIAWLYAVENYFHATNMPMRLRVSFARTLLEGPAITWLRALESQRGDMIRDWTDFEQAFRTKFVSPNLAERARRELKNMKQRSSVLSYTAAFNRKLIEAEGVGPLLAKEYYIDGLSDELQRWVRAFNPSTLEEAQVKAEHQESILSKSSRGGWLPIPNIRNASGPTPMQLGNIQDMTFLEALNAINTSFGRQKNNASPAGKKAWNANGVKESPTKNNKNRWTADGKPICNKCEKPGHMANQCANKFAVLAEMIGDDDFDASEPEN